MSITKTKARIETINNLSADTKHFVLNPEEEFSFKAGQFINITIENNGEKIKRPYSISSSPFTKEKIELCIKYVEGGTITPLLWELNEGDKLDIMGPLGTFCLENSSKEKQVFIGTGTGIAPLRSMIFEQLEKEVPKELTLYFGVRYDTEILYAEEFRYLEENYPNFNFIPIVSRPSNNWEGRQGYVQNNLEGIDPFNTEAFVCGLPEMVDQVREKLKLNGMEEQDIHFEKY